MKISTPLASVLLALLPSAFGQQPESSQEAQKPKEARQTQSAGIVRVNELPANKELQCKDLCWL